MTASERGASPTIVICSFLEPEHVDRIEAAAQGEVRYAPELLPIPRYQNDHTAPPRELSGQQRAKWLSLLRSAEVAFDFDWMAPAELRSNAPKLRWIQATSAGIGGFVERNRLDHGDFAMTTAAGVHAQPLAEFALTGVLHFVKNVPELQRRQRAHHWQRYSGNRFAGRTVTVVGMGSVGKQIATTFSALGGHVIGVTRAKRTTNVGGAQMWVTADQLDSVLPRTDVLILCCPLTSQTRGLIDEARLASLPSTCIVVNLARGPVIDEEALIQALSDRAIAAAVLDVFTEEPLAAQSALWDMPNVLISPHSASTIADENRLLTELFLDNLSRYRAGEPLKNRYDPSLGY